VTGGSVRADAWKHVPQGLKSLRENVLDEMMGAPGLAFETWDPPRKCRHNSDSDALYQGPDF
jgi:hypothetical protein